jgi:myo-inositol-1(or 4)-monophosphatase
VRGAGGGGVRGGGRVVSFEAGRRLKEGARGAAGARGASGARVGAGRGDNIRRGGRGLPPGAAIDFHLSSCVAAARAAGRVLVDTWGKRAHLQVKEKGRNDYVSSADRMAEEAALRLIKGRFPDHSIVAEESARKEGTVGYRWYVDPLDGTTNYLHGVPLWCVSVGLSDPQGMYAAAVFDPVRDEMFTAARDKGAHLNGAPIRVARPGKLQKSLLVTGIPFRSLQRADQYLASFRSFMHEGGGIRRDGSAALDLAWVACGRYDGFWEMELSAWDVAAGSLLVTEAGGVVTDFGGRGGYVESGDIIAAAPEIHPDMLRIVRAAYGR